MRMPFTDELRIGEEGQCPWNEYRIRGGNIEFRSIQAKDKAFSHNGGEWRPLSPDEIQLHFALDTLVARWIMDRLHSILYASLPSRKAA